MIQFDEHILLRSFEYTKFIKNLKVFGYKPTLFKKKQSQVSSNFQIRHQHYTLENEEGT